ncbi:FixG Ig-like domain-containing protein, partial [Rhodopseudomonas palustris]
IALVGAIMIYALATRSSLDINVLHERNPLFVALSDGGVRNDYTLRILNKGADRAFEIGVVGLPGARLHAIGIPPRASDRLTIEVGQDQTREVRISLQVPGNMVPTAPTSITIQAKDLATGQIASTKDNFVPPASGGNP